MFEIRANYSGKGWETCKEIGVGKQLFNSVDDAQSEIEFHIFNLVTSFLDGYLLDFDEQRERKLLGIYSLETGEVFQSDNSVER
ncbi:MAG: hypothetical protein COB29_16205 [Sulfitobacter sp.]|nr:MAG: hypothetical protein COB29_16205 [Sulfitobacter sp.]